MCAMYVGCQEDESDVPYCVLSTPHLPPSAYSDGALPGHPSCSAFSWLSYYHCMHQLRIVGETQTTQIAYNTLALLQLRNELFFRDGRRNLQLAQN